MSAKIKDMTTGRPLPLIISFALPLMVGNIFQQLYTVVDTMVVGKALGVDALAALGATDWLYWMLLGMIQGVTQGFGILMAREFGAKQYESLRKVVGSSTSLSIIFALLFLILGQAVAKPILVLLNTPVQIMDGSLLYLRIMFLGIPIVMIYNLLATILRSLGDGQTPLYAMIVAALTNIALDILFVLVLHLGIAGAAVATLIAQGISSIYCLQKIRKINFMTLKKKHFALEPALAGQLLSLGSPMAAQNAIIAVGGMIIQGVVNGYGVAFIGGFTAANKLYGVLEIAATSYGYAMITYVGQNLGAARIERIKTGMGWAIAVALATSALIAAVMLGFGQYIIGAFISGTPEEAAAATKVGVTYLSVMSICLPILYILHVTRSAVQGMGNTVLPMVSGIAEFIMRTGGVLILPALMGENGIFIAEVLAWLGADLILVPSYFVMVKRILR
ncbi:MAG: MATE family efflux transporter [Oscillospiraceae bacterium]|jgi:putative MATE family efflux protein|nr:MATE family efflux transporter [Oscillospiraceae bacterium]MEE1327759.1 MATE family efflux transporter [Oscillospiraceae bacterium]